MTDDAAKAVRQEHWTTVGVGLAALAIIAILLFATASPARIAALQTNGGYALVDNRTRHAFVVASYTGEGAPCGRPVRIAAGNRERAPVCGLEADLFITGRGGPTKTAHHVVGRNGVYEVRWRDGLIVVAHQPY